MASIVTVSDIPKMDIQLVGVSNYAVWGATVRTNLRTAKLWGYVDGSILS